MQTYPIEDLKDETDKIPGEQMKDSKKELKKEYYTTLQKFLLRISGKIKIGSEKKVGWSSPLPLYAFICHKHGIQITYPNGWRETLICPECISEVSAEMKHRIKT